METERPQFSLQRMLGTFAMLATAFAALRWGFQDVRAGSQSPVLAVLFALIVVPASLFYLLGPSAAQVVTTVVLWSAVLLTAISMVVFSLFLIAELIATFM